MRTRNLSTLKKSLFTIIATVFVTRLTVNSCSVTKVVHLAVSASNHKLFIIGNRSFNHRLIIIGTSKNTRTLFDLLFSFSQNNLRFCCAKQTDFKIEFGTQSLTERRTSKTSHMQLPILTFSLA